MTRYRGSLLPRAFAYLALGVTALLVLVPLVLIVSSSFKTEQEIFSYPVHLIPLDITMKNFIALLQNFPLYILNSVKVTVLITVIQVVTSLAGGYALSKLRWRGRDVVLFTFVSSIMIPIQVYIIPQFIVIKNLGLYDTHLALILVSSFTALGIFLSRQFFMTIPDSYIEAAQMDGASHYRIFGSLIVPLSTPVIATIAILSFRYWWNDLFTPLIYLTTRTLKTLPLGLSDFVSEYDVYYGPQMAASLIAIIPVLVLFAAAQKYIVKGVTFSGLTG